MSYNKIHNHRNNSKKIGLGAKGEGREKLYQKQRLREGIINEQNTAQTFLRAKAKMRSFIDHMALTF